MKIKKSILHTPVQQYGFIEHVVENIDYSDTEHVAAVRKLYNLFNENPIESSSVTREIETFTGDRVLYDDVGHKYYTPDGDIMLGGSTWASKQLKKKFDVDMGAAGSSKAWGIKPNVIKKIWNEQGKLAADFGTVIHKWLELFHDHVHDGEKIQKVKKSGDNTHNYILPNHPIVRDIILEFVDEFYDKKENIKSEVFVADNKKKRAGQLDRLVILDEKKKTCLIEDYKISYNIEEVDKKNVLKAPYDKMDSNALSKYWLQLSFYADIMVDAGWDVKGLTIYCYDGTWKKYTNEVIKI